MEPIIVQKAVDSEIKLCNFDLEVKLECHYMFVLVLCKIICTILVNWIAFPLVSHPGMLAIVLQTFIS